MATGDILSFFRRYTATGETYVKLDSATTPTRPDGYLRVATDTGTSFYDGFDSAFDTTNRWSTTVGTVTPTVTTGLLAVSAGTTALATSIAQSQPTFPLLGNMFVNPLAVWKVDAGAKTGAYRFFGMGTAQGSPTVAAPIVDGAGFEFRDTDGALTCVVWAAGVRTAVPFSSGVTSTTNAVTDGASHRYAVYYKTSRVYFEIDTVTVATVAEPTLSTSTLPVLALTVNGGATVSPAAVSSFSFIGVGDTASNGTSISDGNFPWRKAMIGNEGGMSVRHTGTFQNTYSTAFNVASAASATDIAVISGSATKTTYVQRVIVTGIQTTAGLAEVLLIKRSTADTGGTSSAPGIVPHDSSNAAATSIVLAYTANPGALGTAVGTFRRAYAPIAGVTSVVNPIVVFDFGDKGQAITLRGVAQQLAVNLNGVTITGGTFDIVIEWYEI